MSLSHNAEHFHKIVTDIDYNGKSIPVKYVSELVAAMVNQEALHWKSINEVVKSGDDDLVSIISCLLLFFLIHFSMIRRKN
jgi:hypothetical protein